MTASRRFWIEESSTPLLPWEGTPDAPRSYPGPVHETVQDERPLLYGPHGEPLGLAKRRLGFRPPEDRR